MTWFQSSMRDSNLFLNKQSLSEPEFYGDLVYKLLVELIFLIILGK